MRLTSRSDDPGGLQPAPSPFAHCLQHQSCHCYSSKIFGCLSAQLCQWARGVICGVLFPSCKVKSGGLLSALKALMVNLAFTSKSPAHLWKKKKKIPVPRCTPGQLVSVAQASVCKAAWVILMHSQDWEPLRFRGPKVASEVVSRGLLHLPLPLLISV